MAEPKKLRMGVESGPPSYHEEETRVAVLQATIEHYLPSFAVAIKENGKSSTKKDKAEMLILHQDAFAAGYHDDEYMLLGMAIKYAGLHGVTVNISGKNS